MKKWWAKLTRDESLDAAGDADIVAGALQESYGRVKEEGVREVARGIDKVARAAKKTLKDIESQI